MPGSPMWPAAIIPDGQGLALLHPCPDHLRSPNIQQLELYTFSTFGFRCDRLDPMIQIVCESPVESLGSNSLWFQCSKSLWFQHCSIFHLDQQSADSSLGAASGPLLVFVNRVLLGTQPGLFSPRPLSFHQGRLNSWDRDHEWLLDQQKLFTLCSFPEKFTDLWCRYSKILGQMVVLQIFIRLLYLTIILHGCDLHSSVHWVSHINIHCSKDTYFSILGIHLPFQVSIIFKNILFIQLWETQREREREAETQAEGEAGSMHREPDAGFDPGSPGSRPGPKAGAKPLRHPGIPVTWFLNGSSLDLGQVQRSRRKGQHSPVLSLPTESKYWDLEIH